MSSRGFFAMRPINRLAFPNSNLKEQCPDLHIFSPQLSAADFQERIF
jgi:hypothetical protein